jgi:hypothetical protein
VHHGVKNRSVTSCGNVGTGEVSETAADGVFIAIDRGGENLEPMGVLERVIDTKRGVEQRLHEQYPHVAPCVAWTGSHTYTYNKHYSLDAEDKILGLGLGFTFTDEGADARYVAQVAESIELTDERIDSNIDVGYPPLRDWTDRTRSVHENVLVIDGHASYDTVLNA